MKLQPREKKDKLLISKKKAIERTQKDLKIQFSDKTRVIMDSLLDTFIKSYFGILPEIVETPKTDQPVSV